MTSNQLHGKKFEDFVKACGMFPGASDSARTVTAGFDIEARFDRVLGLPTSIKASGNDTIALSDARRFFALNEEFRMIVGRYQQIGVQKVFAVVHEFILSPQELDQLRGGLTLGAVSAFHSGLLLGHFPRGQHEAARQWAAKQKEALSEIETQITLNPKIDSNSQRRLQCSVALQSLVEVCGAAGRHVCHANSIGDFVLPVIQNSARREFRGS